MSKTKKGLLIGAAALTLIGVGASCAGGTESKSSTPSHDAPAATSTPAETPAPQAVADDLQAEQEANPEPAEPELSVAQENAIESAASYLDTAAFSRSGLIDQLKYEGFSKKDATYAVDLLDVNWKQQAVKSAKDYLDTSSFSHSGLVDQLEYEGFTAEQAEYGVTKTGL
jgi:Host cell surface-exposed lipoprotein